MGAEDKTSRGFLLKQREAARHPRTKEAAATNWKWEGSGDRSRSLKNEVASLVFSWGWKDKVFQRVCLKYKADLSGKCCQILKNVHGGAVREPGREFPPMTKVMRRGSDIERRIRTREAPWTCPKTKICLFYYFTTFTNSSDIKGGAIPDHLSLKKINLELDLISLLGIIGVFQFKALWWLSSLPDRFVRTPAATHVIAHSLPTRRGMGSLRYSNNTELLRELKLLE